MSTEYFFPGRTSQRWLGVGPLADDLDQFAASLAAQGYARQSAISKLRLVRNLSRWLERQGLGVEALDEPRIEAFLLTRGPRYVQRGDTVTARQLLSHLRAGGRIPLAAPSPQDSSPFAPIERRYERFLVNERGVSRATVKSYLPVVRAFLVECFAGRDLALETLTVRNVNQFITRQSRRLSRSSVKLLVTALRSFLRHLHQRGDIPADLAGALVPVVNWRLSGIPKSLAGEQVEVVIRSCDPRTAAGRRDRAIVLLLARLGLRAGEVAAMTLDDLDWDAGVVNVSGKGPRRELLPLPREVGEALVFYLRDGRPQCPIRHVFVRVHAPHVGFAGPVAVINVVQRALARAGIDPPFKGAHLLRHSLATAMLGNGASLEEIGQILRHASPDTTWIYAKVDLEALRALGNRLVLSGQLLKRFVASAVHDGIPFITTECALQWATEPRDAQPAQWANRLSMVRGFARYAHGVDPRHEVPPQGLLSGQHRRRRTPYLYRDTEVAALIAAARALSGTTGLRPLTHATMLALLSVTGMRVSEVVNLDRDDVDLTGGVLIVRDSKFGKSRYLPVHASTTRALIRYARHRDRLCPHPLVPAFFLAERGTRITGWALRWTFAKLSKQVGLRPPSTSHGIGPRMHDLRHAFAVNTLLRWYRDEVDVERHIPWLATWLGHAHVSDTYWYLTATPELLHLAARRVDHRSPS